MSKIYAPYIKNLFFFDRGYSEGLNEKSMELLDKVFKLMENFENINEVGGERHSLHITADRGSIEDYVKYSGYFDEDQEIDEHIKEEFEYEYPNEKVWFEIYTIEENGYRILGINNRRAIEIDPDTKMNKWYDLSDFLEWIIEQINWAIDLCKKGEYNDFVKNNLSDNMKVGTILRSDFWNIFPEERKSYNEHIGSADRIRFASNMLEQFTYKDNKPTTRIKDMTAKDFFEACAAGYAGIGSNEDLGDWWDKTSTPIEQYKQCADGRDDKLMSVKYESPKDFNDWVHRKGKYKDCYGGHPWEVCRGGNSTHIGLYVDYDANGYWFSVSGLSYTRSAEAIKFYNAIKEAGYPVIMNDAKQMYNRVTESDYIGIVPHYDMPFYIQSTFNDRDIVDAMHLPEEKIDEILPHVKWKDIQEIKLRG